MMRIFVMYNLRYIFCSMYNNVKYNLLVDTTRVDDIKEDAKPEAA